MNTSSIKWSPFIRWIVDRVFVMFTLKQDVRLPLHTSNTFREEFTALEENARAIILEPSMREIVRMLEQNLLEKFKCTPAMKQRLANKRRMERGSSHRWRLEFLAHFLGCSRSAVWNVWRWALALLFWTFRLASGPL